MLHRLERKWQRWRALSRWERRLLPVLKFRLLAMRCSLRLRGGGPLIAAGLKQALLPTARVPDGLDELVFAQRCEALVRLAAGTHPAVSAGCLPQALVLQRLLLQHGVAARLQVGVARQLQPFDAHAWVECQGVPLGAAIDRYQSFTGVGSER